MNVLTVSLVLLFVGIAFLAAASINYQMRAFRNKKAWLGWTKPYMYTGIPLSLMGLILIFINF